MSLKDFIAWIKIQAQIIEVVLSVEETLKPFYNLRYHNFQPTNQVPTNTYEVETFEPISSSLHKV